MSVYFNRKSQKVLLDLLRNLPKDDFYNLKVSGLDLRKKSKISLTDFYRLPLTTKEELCSYQANKPRDNRNKSIILRARADTLGNEIQFPLSFGDYNRMVAFEEYKFERIGVSKTDICSIVYFPLHHIIPMADALMKLGATYIPIEGDLEQRLSKIINYKLTFLFCTPKTVGDLVNFIKKTKKKSNLHMVVTTGQKITDFQKFAQLAKKYLSAEVIDLIGSTELSGYAFRCREHNQYHFIDKDQIVEIVDPRSLRPSNEGELVITPLWRRDFPLIRYRTGDYIRLKKRINCRCRIKDLRVFSGVIKRVGSLTKVNGVLVSLDEIFEKVKQHLSFQNPLDHLVWGKLSPPNVFLILDEDNVTDRISIYISRAKYRLTLRRKQPIEDYLESFFGITPQLMLIDRKDSRKLSSYKYLDIRGQENNLLPKEIQMIRKKYSN